MSVDATAAYALLCCGLPLAAFAVLWASLVVGGRAEDDMRRMRQARRVRDIAAAIDPGPYPKP